MNKQIKHKLSNKRKTFRVQLKLDSITVPKINLTPKIKFTDATGLQWLPVFKFQ